MRAVDLSPSLSPEEMRAHHEHIVKSGNENLQSWGEDVCIWTHEQALKALYVQTGLIQLPEGTDSLEGEDNYDRFTRLFKEKLYPDEAFYECLQARLYPEEVRIIPSKELSLGHDTEPAPESLDLNEATNILFRALSEGDVDRAAKMIYLAPDVAKKIIDDGTSPLFWVAQSKKISDVATHRLMQMLIERGAKTDTKAIIDGREVTPLYLACANEKQWSARLLLRHQEAAGSDNLQEFKGDFHALTTLFSAWGNSGRPLNSIRTLKNQPNLATLISARRKIYQLAVLVIGALVGGLVGWLAGFRKVNILASSLVGAVLGGFLFQPCRGTMRVIKGNTLT